MNESVKQPNIVFIMSDDHAAHAMSCYGSKVNQTPHLDRIANEGMRFDQCFCTNSICTPSRAVILTGLYSHMEGNEVMTLADRLDGRKENVAKILQRNGYQTAIVGKWHLGHSENNHPTGFDYWNVLPGQGEYHDPVMIDMGIEKKYEGYVTDIITDLSLDWVKKRDRNRPFFLMYHHKAPHRPWEPDEKHMHLYEDVEIPEPETFHDDYNGRAKAAAEATMRIDRDLLLVDVKEEAPEDYTALERKKWNYQRYMKDYLRCVASVDDNVGRFLDVLDEEGIAENTVVIYTSDQGFFLGDHGWYDKRFMYEESLRMPFIVRYPGQIKAGTVQLNMALNVDFAPTFLELAGLPIPEEMQGRSLCPLLKGETPENWRTSMYYRYWEHMSRPHRVGAHYGMRTDRYKLIHYYGESRRGKGVAAEEWKREAEWEMFDLHQDPNEMQSVHDDPAYLDKFHELKEELFKLKAEVKDDE